MFLVTSSIPQTWNKKEKILFLGEWCILYSQKSNWEILNYKVAKFHWNDNHKRYSDFRYIKDISRKYLVELSECLNEINEQSLSLRSWEIIIGQWLRQFVEQVFDRYHSLQMAIENYDISNTIISKSRLYEFCPEDMKGFYENQNNEYYNLCLFSEIIRFNRTIPYEEKEIVDENIKNDKGNFSVNQLILGSINRFINTLSFGSCKYYLYFTRMPLLSELRFQLSLGQFINKQYLYYNPVMKSSKPDQKLRQKIKLTSSNEFESFLCSILPSQIPSSYIENYNSIYKSSLKKLGKQPNLILTSSGHLNDELFKIWVANMVENGTKLFTTQHGGHYGICKYSSLYEHEVSVSDKFMTWGWKDNKKTIPAPALRLLNSKARNKKKKTNKILWVLSSVPLLSERMYSIPTGPKWVSYINDQINFYKKLDKKIKQNIVCRPFGMDYGWNEQKRLKDKFPELVFDNKRKRLQSVRKKYSLIVETCNQTTFLESLSSNYPTIIFWDEKIWELSENAETFFEELKESNIFFSKPESAARHLNDIFHRYNEWWCSAKVQRARQNFCKNFARKEDHWEITWKKIIKT